MLKNHYKLKYPFKIKKKLLNFSLCLEHSKKNSFFKKKKNINLNCFKQAEKYV